MTYQVSLYNWGKLNYGTAWSRQETTAEAVRSGGRDALVLVEHSPVYTFGRRIRPEHLLASSEDLILRGAELVESDRGGDITFHGPGQIVAYPILDLKRRGLGPSDYVRGLEEVLIRTVARFGIEAERSPGRPGVWVGHAKIAAIGVRVRGGVTTHGFALNVETDLSYFDAIVPCGLAGAGVTSMQRELGATPGLEAVRHTLVEEFAAVFSSEVSAATELSPLPHGENRGEGNAPNLAPSLTSANNGKVLVAHGH